MVRNTAQKIEWFAFNDINMSKQASSFYADAHIQANWQIEGGDSTPPQSTDSDNDRICSLERFLA